MLSKAVTLQRGCFFIFAEVHRQARSLHNTVKRFHRQVRSLHNTVNGFHRQVMDILIKRWPYIIIRITIVDQYNKQKSPLFKKAFTEFLIPNSW